MSITLTYPCGATQISIEPLSTRGRNRVRLAVFDSDRGLAGPKHSDGSRAFCIAGCPVPHRGRKSEKCWPSDESKKPPSWRYVITCLATQKRLRLVDGGSR